MNKYDVDSKKLKDSLIDENIRLKQRISQLEERLNKIEYIQSELKESELRYRNLVDSSPIPIFVHSDEKIVLINNEAVQILGGSSSDDFIGKSLWDILPKSNFETAKSRINQIYEKKGNQSIIDFKFLRIDGIEIDVEVMGTCIDFKGNPASQVVFRDVTQWKQAEESLKIQKIYMKELFESSPDAIVILDQDGKVIRINREFQKLFGYTEQEVVGKSIIDLIVPKEFKDEALIVNEKILSNQEVEFESIRCSKSGKKIDVIVRGKPFVYGKNQLAAYGIYHDITKRKQSELEKHKLEAQLRHIQKMEAIGSLASGIAHDFNNILSVIIGFTELASAEIKEDDSVQMKLTGVLSAADKARELVKQILMFSRKDEQNREPISLGKLLRDSLRLLRGTLPSYIEIRSDIVDPLKPIFANAAQINQVIMNICTNAAHSMRKTGGFLEVTLKEIELDEFSLKKGILEPGEYLLMTFRDSGHGMSPETLERIFEPYFTTKAHEEGTGLGLAVVHGIIKNHYGDITVTSEPGKGTIFNIYLPVTEHKQIVDNSIDEGPIKKGSGRILLIDDDPALIEVGNLLLKGLGYQVLSKGSGMDALEVFKANPYDFDLIITDQTMPQITGDELAMEIKRIRPDIPIVLCTGFSERVNEDNFKSQGIDAFLMKPLAGKELSKILHDLLDSPPAKNQ